MSGRPDAIVVPIQVPLRLYPAEPREPSGGPAPVLLAMHGYAMSPLPMLGIARQLAPPSFLVVAIQGPQSAYAPENTPADPKVGFHFGVSPEADDNRATHRAAAAAAIAWAASHGGDPGRVSLVGFSHPCSFNYRLALHPPHEAPFRAVVAICGGLPGKWTDLDPPGTPFSKATHVLHISTRDDEWYPLEKTTPYRNRLAVRFASAEHLLFDGGHRAPSASFDAIREFLTKNG